MEYMQTISQILAAKSRRAQRRRVHEAAALIHEKCGLTFAQACQGLFTNKPEAMWQVANRNVARHNELIRAHNKRIEDVRKHRPYKQQYLYDEYMKVLEWQVSMGLSIL